MIYMRDRGARKKSDPQQMAKRLVLDEIRHKIIQGSRTNSNHLEEDKGRGMPGSIDKSREPGLYQIASKGERAALIGQFEKHRMCESIVVEEGGKSIATDSY